MRAGTKQVGDVQNHAAKFVKVLNGRKQPIRGLWERNGRFYARLAIEDDDTGRKDVRRVPLLGDDQQPVATVAQAVDALNALKTDRTRDALPVLHRTPKFADFVQTYLRDMKAGQGQKGEATLYKEEKNLAKWVEHMGGVRLDNIRMTHINAFKTKRLSAGLSNRAINLDAGILRNVLRHAVDLRHIRSLPMANMRRLKVDTKERPLATPTQLESICEAAQAIVGGKPVTKNGSQFADYLRFLAYSGCREQEALAIRWQDVDLDNEVLTVGAAKKTKNLEPRRVNFNVKLAGLLQQMHANRAPDSQWLFPSPQRGSKDVHTKTFRSSLTLARKHAKLEWIAFHDWRHYFISYCVMSLVDFMTIAKWVGHKDGGVLIGKVYGHLADAHKKQMAAKVNFGPAIVEAKEAHQ